MKATKKGLHGGWSSSQRLVQENANDVLAVHLNLSPMLAGLQTLNAPADKVQANWMARGHIQSFEVTAQTMVLFVHPLKPISQGIHRYWTMNPRLQLQLFSAYLCDFVVDIFSMAPEGPPFRALKDGGEILTMNIEQHEFQILQHSKIQDEKIEG